MRNLLTLWLLILLTVTDLFAQNEGGSFLVFGNMSVPTGDFGKALGDRPRITRRHGFDIGQDVGLAKNGYALGVEFDTPTSAKGLNWVMSAMFLLNRTDESDATTEFERQLGDSVDVNLDFGTWLNLPVMTGFKYKLPLSKSIGIYGTVQGGINFSKAPSRRAAISGRTTVTVQSAVVNRDFSNETVEETTFKLARDFGFVLGAGLMINRRIDIGFRYLGLGTPTYEGTLKLSERYFTQIVRRETDVLGEDRKVSMSLFYVGIHL